MTTSALSATLLNMTPDEVDALVAGNVRARRAKLRSTQQDIADEVGLSRPAFSALESGTRRITLAEAIDLCRALEIDLRELLRGAPGDVFDTLGIN